MLKFSRPEEEVGLTNRWSSRLRGRQEPRALARKEHRLRVVVGGAAQLHVILTLDARKGSPRHDNTLAAEPAMPAGRNQRAALLSRSPRSSSMTYYKCRLSIRSVDSANSTIANH
jgi:hypothetical protein